MGIFGHKSAPATQTPSQLPNGIQINSSTYGDVIPVAFGPQRLPMKLIWQGDWTDHVTTTPGQHVGKGGGGSTTPGTTTHSYTTALLALLSYGPVDRLDSFWTNAGKVGVSQQSSNFTVPMGGGHFDINDPNFSGDYGVGQHLAYSQLYDDFGGGSGTLSGTYQAPMTRGTVAAPGVYTVTHPATGVTRYTFHSGDAGTTVTLYYSTVLGTVWKSDEVTLTGTTFTVPNTSLFIGNSTVRYATTGVGFFGPGPGGLSYSPPAGFYAADNSGNFKFNSTDIGQTIIITWQEKDPSVDAASAALSFSLAQGGQGQSPWSYLTSTHPDQALGYTGMCLWEFPSLNLGSSNSLPQLTAEIVNTQYMAGGGAAGCNPADVIKAILTDPQWGVGLDESLLGDWSNARAFWQANGFFISPMFDSQTTAQDAINTILEAGQGTMFWHQGLLQMAVYGDTSVAGFGSIYIPDTQPVVEFDLTDLIGDPVKVETSPQSQCFNRVKVQWKNSFVDYQTEVITEENSASIAQNGLLEEGQQDWTFIQYVNIAQWAATMRLRRMTNIRDTYTIKVTSRYRPLLQPMKLVTLTWPHMGWDNKALRILKIEESHEGLALTCEEFPYGVANAPQYPKLTTKAINQNPSLISPGDTTLFALELPDKFNDYQGNTVRIYCDPDTPDNWGGAEVYFSGDETNWRRLGSLNAPVSIGTLGGSGMSVGTGDPDTQTITINEANDVPLLSASTFEFANHLTLLAIDNEIMGYHTATLVGDSVYHVSGFHRGLYGTTRASHSAGATVIQLGDAFLDFQFPDEQVGNTYYFRALSFNKLLGRMQDITDVTSLSVPLSNSNPGLFTNGTINVNVPANKCIYGSLLTVESLKPAEAGAEQTTGKPVDILADGNYMRTPTGVTLTPDTPYNGDFELFADSKTVAEGWTAGFESTGSGYSTSRSGTAFSGNYAQAITNNGASGGTSVASRPFSVKGGVSYTFRCRVQANHTGTGSIYFRVLWYSNDTDMSRSGSSFISFNDILSAGSVASANTYQQLSGEVQAPSNAVFARIALYNWSGSSTVTTAIFDRVSGQLSTIAMNAVSDDVSSGRYAGSTMGGNTDGFQVLTNTEFPSGSLAIATAGTTAYTVYDNNATGHVTLSTEVDVAAPNTSGYRMKIHVSAAGESPGLGGFYVAIGADSGPFAVNTYHKGSSYIWRIRALIPSGHNLNFASNAYGTGGTFTWLGDQSGTGAWKEYVAKQVVGTSGSFSTTGFFYLDGSAPSAFDWYVARVSLVCLDAPATMHIDYAPRVQYLDKTTGQSPTSTMLNPQNSIIPGQSVAFTFSEPSTSQLTQSWGSQTLNRPDGSTLTLAGASHTFSGLSPSQTYYFYPYLTISGSSAIMNFLGPYTSPSASVAFNAYLDGRFALGAFHDATPSSGIGPGGGGDPGDCPHEDELVWIIRDGGEPKRVRIGDVVVGDLIKGWSFAKNKDVYREVKSYRHRPGNLWMNVRGYLTSVCETVFVNGEWLPAYKVEGAERVRGVHANRVEIKVDTHLPLTERNYWMDNGIDEPLLMHNFIPFS